MRRDPAVTFRGALQILGHGDSGWLSRLNDLLGGVILASGVVTGGVGALWSWVDQKNEAVSLTRTALRSLAARLSGASGLPRHELVVAAHTTLVVTSFFDELRELLPRHYSQAAISDAEKLMLASGEWQGAADEFARYLYQMEVPAPSATCGFRENIVLIDRWAHDRAKHVYAFFAGISLHAGAEAVLTIDFSTGVARRYESYYLEFSQTVHEFKVWSDFGEHAATRSAFSRLESLLATATAWPAPRDLRATMADLNRAELNRPVINATTDGYGFDAVFPTVADIFVTPRFRLMAKPQNASLADEKAWAAHTWPHHDLDQALARHFSSADATRRPLLLLGHPGAGKSLLTKVLAARLPTSSFTTVRVPLRSVDANAHVSAQIEQALTLATHGRVRWAELADQSTDVIRVILLDGLDELLQATTHDRSGYLTDIAEFQRTESALGHPVAIVVTSRTVVVDRVLVPVGTPVIRLEAFDDHQVRQWLRVWHETNPSLRPMTAEAALSQGDLARQPLLLLMLALYFADPKTEMPVGGLSQNELYQRLFETYAQREVTKSAGRALSAIELAEGVREQLVRLSVAAIGMFNRGRQSITETELGHDLTSLDIATPAGRLLGEFFFIHSSEANDGSVHRAYEFLHATFGEYLVAAWVVDVLCDVAEGSWNRRRFHEPDDELLLALLSHQPLSLRWRVIEFVSDNLMARDVKEREYVLHTVEFLITNHRQRRHARRFSEYRPLAPDVVRALATYSANLVLLRISILDTPMRLAGLWPAQHAGVAWRSLVNLWSAGLEAEGYRTIVISLDVRDDVVLFRRGPGNVEKEFLEYWSARLRRNQALEARLRLAHAVQDEMQFPVDDATSWETACIGWLLSLVLGKSPWLTSIDVPPPPADTPQDVVRKVHHMAVLVANLRGDTWSREFGTAYQIWCQQSFPPHDMAVIDVPRPPHKPRYR